MDNSKEVRKNTLCQYTSRIVEDAVNNLLNLSTLDISGLEEGDVFHPNYFRKLSIDCKGAAIVLEAVIRDKDIKIRRLERRIEELENRLKKLEIAVTYDDKTEVDGWYNEEHTMEEWARKTGDMAVLGCMSREDKIRTGKY